jgi:phage terminase small subunit
MEALAKSPSYKRAKRARKIKEADSVDLRDTAVLTQGISNHEAPIQLSTTAREIIKEVALNDGGEFGPFDTTVPGNFRPHEIKKWNEMMEIIPKVKFLCNADRPSVIRLAMLEAMAEYCHERMMDGDIIFDDGEKSGPREHPIVKIYFRALASASTLGSKLGIDPISRLRMQKYFYQNLIISGERATFEIHSEQEKAPIEESMNELFKQMLISS